MKKIEIIEDCKCAKDEHEILNYPREGLVLRAFKKGQILEVQDEWMNFYGTYYNVKVDGDIRTADIPRKYGREV